MSGYSFEVREHDALGRLCRFTTPHGTVRTPTLLPVINPRIRSITASDMVRDFGAQMVITNSYIIHRSPELREAALSRGLHSLLDFDGPVMTDSGTFQMYMYNLRRGHGRRTAVEEEGAAADPAGGSAGGAGGGQGGGGDDGPVEIDPQDIVAFQRDIGSDVGTILDVFSTPDRTREQSARDAAETLRRARASMDTAGEMGLALPVQGGVHPDLRKSCAKEMSALEGVVYPIGGVVPLMEGYRYDLMARLVLAVREGLTWGRPVHLFGCGHPMFMALSAAMGCDMFDSSAYAKYAAGGRMMFCFGTRRLCEMKELPCSCPVCSGNDVAGLMEMPAPEREVLLARHNLHASFAEVRAIRQSISEGSLWELVEARAAAHPALHRAFRYLLKRWEFIAPSEPGSKRRYMASTPDAALRPEMQRFHSRLITRYRPPASAVYTPPASAVEMPPSAGDAGVTAAPTPTPTLAVIPAHNTPLSRHFRRELARLQKAGIHALFQTSMGPVPPELDEMYPYGQCVLPGQTAGDGEPRGASAEDGRTPPGPGQDDATVDDAAADDEDGIAAARLEEFCGAHGYRRRVVWSRRVPLDEFIGDVVDLSDVAGPKGEADGAGDDEGNGRRGTGASARDARDIARLRAVCDHQFGRGTFESIIGGEDKAAGLALNRSKNTGKLRTVHDARGNHLLSMRAKDGLMILRKAAAVNLHGRLGAPSLRVTVKDDSVPFNREGRSVFAHFVTGCDPDIVPGDEVLVVDGDDALVAVGQAVMGAREMADFQSGVAVDVREGLAP